MVAAVAALASLAPVPVSPVHAYSCDYGPSIDVFEARAEAGGIHDSIAVPAYFETFLPYSLDEASNGSAHGYHSTFYGGFFLTAAAEQYGAPKPPGTTETLFPQGPVEASAQAIPFPGAEMGASRGRSSATASEGRATFGGGAFGPAGRIGFGETTSSVKVGEVVRSTATLVMHDLVLGPLTIGAVRASAEAVSGAARGTGKASKSVTFSEVRLSGVPLSPTGDLPDTAGANALLAQAGLTITRRPEVVKLSPDGTSTQVALGGVTVTFSQPAQEFTVTWTLGRVQALARALPPIPRGCGPGLPPGFAGAPTVDEIPAISGGGAVPTASAIAAPTALATTTPAELRRIRRTSVARGMDVTTLAAVFALLAIFSSLARRAFRAVASP